MKAGVGRLPSETASGLSARCTCPGKQCVGVVESSNRLISDGKFLVFKGESPHREAALQVNVLPAGAVTLPIGMSV